MRSGRRLIANRPVRHARFLAVPIAAFAFDNGMTKTLLDPAAFIDASFLKKAAPERVTLP